MNNARANPASKLAMVIGVSGGMGHATTHSLISKGWTVRALVRDPADARHQTMRATGVQLVAGDAMRATDVAAAAAGASIILHAANPPNYRNWRGLAIPMLDNAIAAARASKARLVFPGNVYNFGPDAGEVINEDSPQNPLTRKGKVRVEMEQMLQRAAGVRSLIVRAGDVFGAPAPSSNFSRVMVTPGRPLRHVTYPGRPDVGHVWAYLPDLGETIAELAGMDASLRDVDSFNFGGHWIDPGTEIVNAIRRVSGIDNLPVRAFPWKTVGVLRHVVPLLNEVYEMRYLWKVPVRLDNRKLVAALGREPRTDLDTAVQQTLRGLGIPFPHASLRQARTERVT
jgi:nucleoside-diphosphate-sugar epimerase